MKKKLLLLGAEGMLGHVCLIKLSEKFQVLATTKNKRNIIFDNLNFLNDSVILENVDLTNFEKIEKIIKKFKPKYLVNCAGVINKKISNYSKANSIKINSLLPHILSNLSELYKFRFLHISTDCVFDGSKGDYYEYDKKNAVDFYGQTKSIGEEFSNKRSIILRTSIIGHEIKSKLGMMEWFLNSKKKVEGYAAFRYSGITTLEIQRFIIYFLNQKKMSGLYNLASTTITKYKLLKIINNVYNKKIIILKNRYVKKNMVLKSNKLKLSNKNKPQSWQKQIEDLKKFYEKNYKKV